MKNPPSHDELLAYLEGEVTTARAAEIEVALENSDALRAELDEARALVESLRGLPPELETVDLVAGVRAALEQPPKERSISRASRWLAAGSALAVAAALAVFIVPETQHTDPDDFAGESTLPPGMRAKAGGADAATRWTGLKIFRTEPVALVDGRIGSEEPLAFAYSNLDRRPFTHLAVFAVDANGDVRWYYPEWKDASSTPSSLEIKGGADVELGERIAHRFEEGTLKVVALFTRAPLTVTAIEAALKTSPALEDIGTRGLGLSAEDVAVRVQSLEVAR